MNTSKLVDQKIAELGGWRGALLATIRALVYEVEPNTVEDIKWKGAAVWAHNGVICAVDTQAKDMVKLIFLQGAKLPDPKHLFNAELNGNARRAIKLYENDKLDKAGLKALISAVVHPAV